MQKSRVWAIVCYASWVIGVIGLAGLFGFSTHYMYANPTSPSPRTGHIYPYKNRGTVVYLKKEELLSIRLLDGALWVGMAGFVVGGAFAGFFRGKT